MNDYKEDPNYGGSQEVIYIFGWPITTHNKTPNFIGYFVSNTYSTTQHKIYTCWTVKIKSKLNLLPTSNHPIKHAKIFDTK